MKVLVTGATGFVGDFLMNENKDDQIIYRGAYRGDLKDSFNQQGEYFEVGNIDDRTAWSEALDGVQAVVHTAARAHVMYDKSKDPLKEYFKVNVEGTIRLAEEALRQGIKRFIFISSAKVNGENSSLGNPLIVDETQPIGPYALSKFKAEKELINLSSSKGLELIIIRPALIYGPGVKGNFLTLMKLVKKGIPMPFGLINNKRSFISIYNLASFITVCLKNVDLKNEIFLISDDSDLSTKELIKKLADAFNKKIILVPIHPEVIKFLAGLIGREDSISRLCDSFHLDISKAKVLLNWKPLLTFEEGIKKTVEYYNSS